MIRAPAPCPEWEAAMLHHLVRQYPRGGNRLEAALRDALRLGFSAGRLAVSGDARIADAPPSTRSKLPSETNHA